MKETIILYPAMGRGHLVPMVELGKFISTHHHATLSVKILLPSPPNTATLEYIAAASATALSLAFHHLSSSQHLLPFLQSITSENSKPKAFIFDFFNHSAADVTKTLNIPTFFFFPNSASCVALLLYTPMLFKKGNFYSNIINVPGLPAFSRVDMPEPFQHHRSHDSYMKLSLEMRKSNGIIVNTFQKLENNAFEALQNGACVPDAPQKPHVFCIGPMVSKDGDGGGDGACLSWLDSQPSQSVVYLSFGSYGRFSKSQIKEIAVGLERSGQRFLWIVRNPIGYENREIKLEELLPKGFMERTKERGMVVRNWAPQVKVLSHDSVGGFVTHCGWNSILEAVSCGVPMVAWPLYAEQRLNKVIMVEEMKVGLALKENDEGFVSATELENRVMEVMDSDRGRGREMRERVLRARNVAIAAVSDGGSSRVALDGLVELWMQMQ